MGLYGALGIGRDDKEAREAVWEANYRFFDAPVGLFFLIDADVEKGSWLDMGMFLENVMLAAIHFGLATCPQAALAAYPHIVRAQLDLPAHKQVVSGMALGYPDMTQPINQYRTAREPLSTWVRYCD